MNAFLRCPHTVRRPSLTLVATTRGRTFTVAEKCVACGNTVASEYALVEPFPGAGLPRLRGGDTGRVCTDPRTADALRDFQYRAARRWPDGGGP